MYAGRCFLSMVSIVSGVIMAMFAVLRLGLQKFKWDSRKSITSILSCCYEGQ